MDEAKDEWIGLDEVSTEMGYTQRQAWEYIRSIGLPTANARRMELVRFRRADFEEARKRALVPLAPRSRTGVGVPQEGPLPATDRGGSEAAALAAYAAKRERLRKA